MYVINKEMPFHANRNMYEFPRWEGKCFPIYCSFSFFLLPNTACEHQAKTTVPSRNIMSSTLSNLVAIWGTNRPCQILVMSELVKTDIKVTFKS